MCNTNNETDYRLPGSLTRLNMYPELREYLLDYMKVAQPKSYTDIIWNMLGDRNFLMFFDVLEGQTIRIPSRQNMARIISNLAIYSYVKARGCSTEVLEKAALIFKKRPNMIEKIYTDIENAITNGEYTEEEEEDVEG